MRACVHVHLDTIVYAERSSGEYILLVIEITVFCLITSPDDCHLCCCHWPPAGFSVSRALQLGLPKFLAELEEVSEYASKEYSLERTLDKMQLDWTGELGCTGSKDVGLGVGLPRIQCRILGLIWDRPTQTEMGLA